MSFTPSVEHMQELLTIAQQKAIHLERQIKRLADFILALDCGFPTINDQYPGLIYLTHMPRQEENGGAPQNSETNQSQEGENNPLCNHLKRAAISQTSSMPYLGLCALLLAASSSTWYSTRCSQHRQHLQVIKEGM